MGNAVAPGGILFNSGMAEEVQTSIDQVIHAFEDEIQFHMAKNQQQPSISQSFNATFESLISTDKQSHSRSRSLDQPSVEIHPLEAKFSELKRQWQCQLCHTKNESNFQICTDCGSNKINVYIPIIDHSRSHLQKPRHISSNSLSASGSLRQSNRSIRSNRSTDEECARRRSVLIVHKRKADELIVSKHVDKILLACQTDHSRFKDEHFPASSLSLYINGKTLSRSTVALVPNQQQEQSPRSSSASSRIQWLRPDQIVPQEWSDNDRTTWAVFRDPRPNDVLQGALGDCWFITALSVLAEEPEYLKKILITDQYNQEGVYCVRLCKDGEWMQVLVDDRFPCTSSRKLAYSQAHRKQLWVPLIEKALAKLNGSYESIIAGRCCEGLTTVTGSPCETLILGRSNNPDDKNVDYKKLWDKLHNARAQRFVMCAMCSNNLISQEEFEKFGLLNIHAYSLQDLKESKDGKHHLIKLRNPWGGAYRWTGDWSDDSRLWSENAELRRELLNEQRNKRDGVFWMPFVSFVRYFECVDICKLRPHWYEVRDTANFCPTEKMMQGYYLIVSKETELDLSLHRKISKNLRIQRSDVSLCIAIISVGEQSNGSYRIVSMPVVSQRGQHKFVSTDGKLPAGTYVILPFLFNPSKKHLDNTDFTLVIHSSYAVDLERTLVTRRIEREFLIKFCMFYGESVRTANTTDTSQSDGVKIYELKTFWDGLIVLVENRNPSKYVHFYFRCSVSHNALISRKDSSQELFDVIPPNYRQIIVSISRKSPAQSFRIGHDFQYILSSQNVLKQGEGFQQKHWPPIDESQLSTDIHLPQGISAAKHH